MIKIFLLSVVTVLFIVLQSCNAQKENTSRKSIIDKKVDSLLSIMTLEEKVGQMNQYNGSWNDDKLTESGKLTRSINRKWHN